jgi:hypothetical protein
MAAKKASKKAAKKAERKPTSSKKTSVQQAAPRPDPQEDKGKPPLRMFSLDELDLDPENPRLGRRPLKGQHQVLDAIVDAHGVDDVLSSLAVNGYFASEPLVGMLSKGRVVIVEGNRRLAACLILAGDPRAKAHEKRIARFRSLMAAHDTSPPTTVPVILRTSRREILAYLGVRHISSIQPWDAYAKARWVSDVLEGDEGLTIADISEMVGDQFRTVARIVEGYRVVRQLEQEQRFTPSQSSRAGRGSNVDFPFSWVYTALGYNTIREWLSLGALDASAEKKAPLEKGKLDDAASLMTMLFGDSRKDVAPNVSDSRQISDLARAVGDPVQRRRLQSGKSVEEVIEDAKPPKERVFACLLETRDQLSKAVVACVEITELGDRLELLPEAKKVERLAGRVRSELSE